MFFPKLSGADDKTVIAEPAGLIVDRRTRLLVDCLNHGAGAPALPALKKHGAPAVGATYDADGSRPSRPVDIAERPDARNSLAAPDCCRAVPVRYGLWFKPENASSRGDAGAGRGG